MCQIFNLYAYKSMLKVNYLLTHLSKSLPTACYAEVFHVPLSMGRD